MKYGCDIGLTLIVERHVTWGGLWLRPLIGWGDLADAAVVPRMDKPCQSVAGQGVSVLIRRGTNGPQ